jgi:hypothetical protein
MKREVTIDPTNEEIAEAIFNKDTNDIAEILGLVHKKFETNYYENKGIQWNSFGMCLYVADAMNDNTRDFIENLYHAMWYKHGKDIMERNPVKMF